MGGGWWAIAFFFLRDGWWAIGFFLLDDWWAIAVILWGCLLSLCSVPDCAFAKAVRRLLQRV